MDSEKDIVITKEMVKAIKDAKNEKVEPLLIPAMELSRETKIYFENQLALASNDLEYLFALAGLINYGYYGGVKWMFDELQPGESLGIEELLFELRETFGNEIKMDAIALGFLKEELLKGGIPDDKNVVIVLKGSDIPNLESGSGFYVLASLAPSQNMDTDNKSGKAMVTINDRHLVFLKPNFVPCVEHLCSVLYRTQKANGLSSHFFDIRSRVDIKKNIVLDENGVAQFVIAKDEEGRGITQDIEAYTLCALALGIDKRVNRKMVPDTSIRVKKTPRLMGCLERSDGPIAVLIAIENGGKSCNSVWKVVTSFFPNHKVFFIVGFS